MTLMNCEFGNRMYRNHVLLAHGVAVYDSFSDPADWPTVLWVCARIWVCDLERSWTPVSMHVDPLNLKLPLEPRCFFTVGPFKGRSTIQMFARLQPRCTWGVRSSGFVCRFGRLLPTFRYSLPFPFSRVKKSKKTSHQLTLRNIPTERRPRFRRLLATFPPRRPGLFQYSPCGICGEKEIVGVDFYTSTVFSP
jgi:hypothetical protein